MESFFLEEWFFLCVLFKEELFNFWEDFFCFFILKFKKFYCGFKFLMCCVLEMLVIK